MRIASNHIVTLQSNEIFVFGSNLAGQHGWLIKIQYLDIHRNSAMKI